MATIMRTVMGAARIAMPLMFFAGLGMYFAMVSKDKGYEFNGRAIVAWLITAVVILVLLKLAVGSFRRVVQHQVPLKVLVFGLASLALAAGAGTLLWIMLTNPVLLEARLYATPFGVAVVVAWFFVRHQQSLVGNDAAVQVDEDERLHAHS